MVQAEGFSYRQKVQVYPVDSYRKKPLPQFFSERVVSKLLSTKELLPIAVHTPDGPTFSPRAAFSALTEMPPPRGAGSKLYALGNFFWENRGHLLTADEVIRAKWELEPNDLTDFYHPNYWSDLNRVRKAWPDFCFITTEKQIPAVFMLPTTVVQKLRGATLYVPFPGFRQLAHEARALWGIDISPFLHFKISLPEDREDPHVHLGPTMPTNELIVFLNLLRNPLGVHRKVLRRVLNETDVFTTDNVVWTAISRLRSFLSEQNIGVQIPEAIHSTYFLERQR